MVFHTSKIPHFYIDLNHIIYTNISSQTYALLKQETLAFIFYYLCSGVAVIFTENKRYGHFHFVFALVKFEMNFERRRFTLDNFVRK